MTAVNHFKVLLLIISCLFFCNHIHCFEQSKVVAAQTNSNIENPTTTTKNQDEQTITNWVIDHIKYTRDEHQKEEKEEREEREKEREKEKEKERERDRKDDKKNEKYPPSEHNNNGGDDDDNDRNQRKYTHSRTDSTPSSTIVTTIIVVTTETPTIYTGNVTPAQQKGSGETDTVTTDNNNNNPSPSETAFVDKLIKGRDAYHRLVLALSVVGGIAGIALITGAFIFTRMRSRKRKRKQALDLEGAHVTIASSPSSPKPPPPAHCRTSSIRSEDGEMTIIDFSQDPFQDPSDTLPYYKNNNSTQNGFHLSPSEPPSNQYNGRQNQTLSMLSQTTSATLPSAPTAKELDSPNYENPFDDQRGDSISPNASIPSHGSSQNVKNIPSPPLLSQMASHHQQTRPEFPPDLPPPPAYTPSATPSAPPLYALPTNGRALTPHHEEDTSRRHSISSFSITSSIRPISLRRGSGSHAYISSPFS